MLKKSVMQQLSIDLCRIWTIISVFISKYCYFVTTANKDCLIRFDVVDVLCIYTEKWITFILEALLHQNCLKYNNYFWKQLCSTIFCTIRMLNTDECFLFIFIFIFIYEGNMLECTNHMESIHSNFVISRNHWPALSVWGDKTNRISQNWSLVYHHTSPQDVHPRIRSTGQSASQQHTYHSARRGNECGEWHLTLPLRKGCCPTD